MMSSVHEKNTASISSELSLSSGDESGENDPINISSIRPYQFEPEFSSGDEVEVVDIVHPPEEDDEARTTNLDWCTCENCQRLPTSAECQCCLEFPQIVAKNLEAVEVGECDQPPPCITEHPGFQAVCLNRWVLQAAWYQYKQQYYQSYDGPEHKLNRHVAYRQLVRWCWGIIGKEIRVPLPSCAVCCIRSHFPPPGLEEDILFEGFHFSDE